ncbi:hypothetical protein J1605_002002 [Eschrichtius robustus]|uniref:Homeobox protein Hox-D1 n=1 Tax=Eschrichtius robustus TaxID=9764 RepID=A0AB34HYY7_ESCRO|nr:hypothetical protein J1605_002002 [Eschrichtius robustus]
MSWTTFTVFYWQRCGEDARSCELLHEAHAHPCSPYKTRLVTPTRFTAHAAPTHPRPVADLLTGDPSLFSVLHGVFQLTKSRPKKGDNEDQRRPQCCLKVVAVRVPEGSCAGAQRGKAERRRPRRSCGPLTGARPPRSGGWAGTLSSYLRYVSRGSGRGGGDVLSFAPKFCRADARPVVPQPALPLGSGDGAFASRLPPAAPARPPAPPPAAYAPCPRGGDRRGAGRRTCRGWGRGLRSPGARARVRLPARARGRPAGRRRRGARPLRRLGRLPGRRLLPPQQPGGLRGAFGGAAPFPACLKEPAEGHSGAFQTASRARGACPKSAPPPRGLPAAFSTFEWTTVKRNASPEEKQIRQPLQRDPHGLQHPATNRTREGVANSLQLRDTQVANSLQLRDTQVKIRFQNRRMKQKKREREEKGFCPRPPP